MLRAARSIAGLGLLAVTACATSGRHSVREGSVVSADSARKYFDPSEIHGEARLVDWAPYASESFARARRENRHVLIHGAAEWCHFCHVMEAVTYRHPEVVRLLRERFVTIRVDVDAHPDIEERYGDWGWPATIVLSPLAEELGKFRGYLPPEAMLAALTSILSTDGPSRTEPHDPALDISAPTDALPWVAARTALELESYYDPRLGGWGRGHKSPLGENAEYELLRAAHGAPGARERALFSLERQRRLMDPVWGGLYQYSVGGTWEAPHYEKLMTIQAANLEAYARAYAVTGRADFRRDIQAITGYAARFLTSPEGAFYANQDADLGSHDPGAATMAGAEYYARSERDRLAAGIPWIDKRISAFENGLMIAALVAAWDATSDPAILTLATRAADAVLTARVRSDGAVFRGDAPDGIRHLPDAAAIGRAYARLSRATGVDRYLAVALRIESTMTETLLDPETGAYFAHTPDRDAHGVFARRRRPFVHNVLAARFLAELARQGDDTYRQRARRTLAAIATPAALAAQGRMLGAFLLAVEESEPRSRSDSPP